MLKKFPVTSANGNEYLVELKESYLYESHYEVRVYEKYIGWFGRERYRFLNEMILGSARSYDIRDYGFDFTKMAMREVSRMEDEWKAQALLEKKLLDAKKQFEEWNGDCK